MILENDRLNFYNLSSLKYCWSGGDILPLEVGKLLSREIREEERRRIEKGEKTIRV
jgi:hypothetical protein